MKIFDVILGLVMIVCIATCGTLLVMEYHKNEWALHHNMYPLYAAIALWIVSMIGMIKYRPRGK